MFFDAMLAEYMSSSTLEELEELKTGLLKEADSLVLGKLEMKSIDKKI